MEDVFVFAILLGIIFGVLLGITIPKIIDNHQKRKIEKEAIEKIKEQGKNFIIDGKEQDLLKEIKVNSILEENNQKKKSFLEKIKSLFIKDKIESRSDNFPLPSKQLSKKVKKDGKRSKR